MTEEPAEYDLLKKRNELLANEEKIKRLQELVDMQAEDWDLWFSDNNLANTKSRAAKLRIALRELHALIEE